MENWVLPLWMNESKKKYGVRKRRKEGVKDEDSREGVKDEESREGEKV